MIWEHPGSPVIQGNNITHKVMATVFREKKGLLLILFYKQKQLTLIITSKLYVNYGKIFVKIALKWLPKVKKILKDMQLSILLRPLNEIRKIWWETLDLPPLAVVT